MLEAQKDSSKVAELGKPLVEMSEVQLACRLVSMPDSLLD
jgi:hypothetical protein